jgi:gluconokinase
MPMSLQMSCANGAGTLCEAWAVVVIIMGAAGAGKSTVGRALAAALDWPFIDADDLHSAADIERMRQGIGLTDQERDPWLARVRQAMLDQIAKAHHAVVACSALKRRYRQILTEGVADARFVHLRADEELLRSRLNTRRGHFAGPALAATQLRDLETPLSEAVIVDAASPPQALVTEIRRALNL